MKENLKTYNSVSEATLPGEPYKTISFNINGKVINKYIGLTKDLDTPKASLIRYEIDGEKYTLRRYKGKTNYDSYMRKTYPDTYKTMTECPEMPDTSDCSSFYCFYSGCVKIKYPKWIDTRNGTSFQEIFGGMWDAIEFPAIDTSKGTNFAHMYNMYSSPLRDTVKFPLLDTGKGTNFREMYSYNNITSTEFPAIDTSNGIVFPGMYRGCKSTQSFPQINTEKGKEFNYMYYNCKKAIKVSDIDLSSISIEDITVNKKLENMLGYCDSLPSVTFNNVPPGITVEQMRTATSAPVTCEIILNHRSE